MASLNHSAGRIDRLMHHALFFVTCVFLNKMIFFTNMVEHIKLFTEFNIKLSSTDFHRIL